MTPAERAQLIAQIGAEILLSLEHTGELPLHDRITIGKAIHDTFVRDGWNSRFAQHDIYWMKRRSSPHYWSLGVLDNICAVLDEAGHPFQHVRDFGWGFLTEEEAEEWRRARDQAAKSFVRGRNKKVQAFNKKWSDRPPIAPLQLNKKLIEGPGFSAQDHDEEP